MSNKIERRKKNCHCKYEGLIRRHFEFVKKVNEQDLVICPNCGKEWLRTELIPYKDLTDLISLTEKQKEILDTLGNTMHPTAKQLETLMQIKGINGDFYGNLLEFIDVPCKITLKDGREMDFSIVRFSKKMPPEKEYVYKHVFNITDVETIEPSEYALPFEVRYETSRAHEKTNSYAPTLIENPEGKVFGLNWMNFFFSTNKYKGSQFTLYHKPHDYLSDVPENLRAEDSYYCYPDDENSKAVVYADWFSDCEKLLCRTFLYTLPT